MIDWCKTLVIMSFFPKRWTSANRTVATIINNSSANFIVLTIAYCELGESEDSYYMFSGGRYLIMFDYEVMMQLWWSILSGDKYYSLSSASATAVIWSI